MAQGGSEDLWSGKSEYQRKDSRAATSKRNPKDLAGLFSMCFPFPLDIVKNLYSHFFPQIGKRHEFTWKFTYDRKKWNPHVHVALTN